MNPPKYYVLITDVDFRKGFDVFNIVRRRHRRIILASGKPNWARFFLSMLAYFKPIHRLRNEDDALFAMDMERMLKYIDSSRIVFLPEEEKTTLCFLAYIESFQKADAFCSLLPNLKTYRAAGNKFELYDLCKEANVGVPQRYEFSDYSNDTLPNHDLVLKPRVGMGGAGLRYLTSEDRSEVLDDLDWDEYLLQDKIGNPREVLGAFYLCDEGTVLSCYCHKRVRTYPESGGVTVYSQSQKNDELERIGAEFICTHNWSGLIMIEFIYDDRDNQYKIIEVNPRIWGSILLSDKNGSHLIDHYIKRAIGINEVATGVEHYDASVSWVIPYELFNIISGKLTLSEFFKSQNKSNANINMTYANPLGSIGFHICQAMDFSKIRKHLKR